LFAFIYRPWYRHWYPFFTNRHLA